METTMELDDLKTAWASLDRRLEQQHALNLQLFRDTRVSKIQFGLRPLIVGQSIQIAVGALICLLFALFWVAHRDVLHLAVYGLSLHAYGIMFIAFAARSLYHISQVDYAAPVLVIQKSLAELRRWQLRAGFWFALAGCFIWTPLMLVIFYKLGADIWVHKPAVVYWFVASSFVAVAITWGLIRISRLPGFERLRKSLDDSAIGHSLRRAQAALDEVARFEQE